MKRTGWQFRMANWAGEPDRNRAAATPGGIDRSVSHRVCRSSRIVLAEGGSRKQTSHYPVLPIRKGYLPGNLSRQARVSPLLFQTPL